MTYFALFDIKPTLQINKNEIKKTYYQLCKAYHPDVLNNKDEEDLDKKIIEINNGFKILNNENLLIKYILEENNCLEENDKTPLPAEFLMKMMELNEEKLEIDAEEKKIIFENKIALIQTEIKKTIAALYVKENLENLNMEELVALKNYYLQNNYLEKLRYKN